MGLMVLFIGLCAGTSALAESRKNCGPGRRPGINGCVNATPRARTNAPAKEARETSPPKPEPMRPPPDGKSRAEIADRILLVQELQQLEALLKKTPKHAPERAAIVKRLAETYADLAKRAEYEREVARLRAEQAKREEKLDAENARRPRTPTTL
jgi:hypothetical protein